MTLMAAALVACPCSARKQKNTPLKTWPDGTAISTWFNDTTTVDVKTLGKEYVITDYGVKKDSSIVQTEAIQAVIDRCAQEGGGVIVIPEGTYMSGSLFFKQGTHLCVRGRLKGSERIRDFRLLTTRMEGQTIKYFAALVNADNLDGFTITGEGAYATNPAAHGMKISQTGFTTPKSCIDGNGHLYWEEFWIRRLYNAKCTNLEAMRPRLVYISNCRNVTVQNINLINSPFWTNHLYRSSEVRYLNCFIYAPTKGIRAYGTDREHGGPSTDAIDIDVCHDILVNNCFMQVNDDAVVIKGGKGTWADKDQNNGPVYNVMVRNCNYGVVHGCLTVGSESVHDWNILVTNCTAVDANRVLWLKMRPDTPQHYEKITVSGMKGKCRSFLVIRPWTQFFAPGDRPDMPLSQCHDITIKGIQMECDRFFDVGLSEKYDLSKFTFSGCKIIDKENTWDPSLIKECKAENMNVIATGEATTFLSNEGHE